MERHVLLLVLLSLGLGLALGWWRGRRSSAAAQRLQRLETELEASRMELEHYRESVSDHFGRTSDLLRDLTIRYRGVYDHLAEGARSLSPETPSMLGQGLEAALLVEEGAESETAPGEGPAASSEETAVREGEGASEEERAPGA